MSTRAGIFLSCVAIAGCSNEPPTPRGRLVVALTIDWEGAYLSADGLDALDALRAELGPAPFTHFVSSAYFTKDRPDPEAADTIARAIRPGDELAVHLHAWRSLARASGVEPRVSPSFLTGTDAVLEFEDGDVGFDTDLDVYGAPELRAMLRTSRRLLERTGLPVSASFRAGGYLGTPRVLQAIRDEGFAIDSSAIDHRQLDEAGGVLVGRVAAIWPGIDPASPPWFPPVRGAPSLVELPVAAFADYTEAAEITAILEAAHDRLGPAPDRDVFVVLGFHQETAADFAGRIGEAVARIRARPDVAKDLLFATVETAGWRARRGSAAR